MVSRGLHSRGQLVGRTFVIGRGVPFPQVPDDAQPLTPVFLMATAGMRRIDPDKADAVLEACRQVLQRSSFRFQAEWASIIPGYQVRSNPRQQPRLAEDCGQSVRLSKRLESKPSHPV